MEEKKLPETEEEFVVPATEKQRKSPCRSIGL